MKNNIVQRRITVTAEYVALSAEPLVVTCEISCEPGNVGVVNFLGDDASDVPWRPGEWFRFERIDLADIQIKGTVGDHVTVVGWSW